jgi:hypothetical protein
VAAYADGGLPARERSDLEVHLSSCARCQAILAVIAQEPVAELPAETKPSGWTRFLTRPSWRWLVPVSAAALGVVLYVAVQQGPDNDIDLTAPPAVAAPEMAMAARAEAAPPVEERAMSDTREPSRPTESLAGSSRASVRPDAPAAAKPADLAARTSVDVVAAAPPPAQPDAQPAALAVLDRPRPESAPRVDVDAPKQTDLTAANTAGTTAGRKTVLAPQAAVWPEAAPKRGKRVRLYEPIVGTGFTLPSIWPLSDLVVHARVTAVGRARLAPAEHGPGQIGLAMGLVPMVPIEVKIVEVFKRRDGIHPGPSITVWHRGGEVEDAVTIHRVPDGEWVQAREGDEFVLFLERRDHEQDSQAFEPFGFADGLYRLDGDRVVIGLNPAPDPELSRGALLARLRQLAGTAAR